MISEPPENENKSSKTLFEKIAKIPAIGIFFALLSCCFISTESLIIKIVSNLHPIELIAFRALGMMIVFVITIFYNKYSFYGAKDERWFLLLRATLGFISSCFGFTAVRYIPLGDASAITFSAPVFVSIFARILLKEPFGILQLITLVTTLCGGFLISRPSFIFGTNEKIEAKNHLIGTLLAFACAVFAALVFVMLRKMQKTPSAVVIFWFSFTTVIFAPLTTMIFDTFKMPKDLKTWMLVALLGLIAAPGQIFMTLAFKLEDAGPVSVTRTISIVISFVYQAVLLKESVVWTSLLGATIVCLSVVIIAIEKWYRRKPEAFQKIFLIFTTSFNMGA
ncbi:solute carrier family 35 member G1-like protein, partial [Dinothrombium tinctorium]